MELDLELAEWKRLARADVRFDESGDDLEFPGLDINLQDINVVVAWSRKINTMKNNICEKMNVPLRSMRL